MVGIKIRLITLTLILIVMFLACGLHAEESYERIYKPEIEVPRLNSSIEIDGDVGDSGWKNAARITRFYEHFPGDQTKPTVETVAMITYDNDHLYVGFICYDDPSTIRATFTQRDRAHYDDNVLLALDTYGDAAWAYEIGANAYGIQVDLLWSRSGNEDDSYDLVWESAAEITDSGYQVEMAIPFSSLRFPDKEEQVWRADFWRNHPRDLRRQMSWAAYDRDQSCWPCQWGTLTGIKGVKPGKGIELLPTLIGSQFGGLTDDDEPDSEFHNDDIDTEASISMKYSVSSSVTAEATINPDFSQVESDATQIDVNTTFALFFPERRPFFQEGSDLFSTWFTPFYTRSINDPIVAGKLIGRMNRTNLAYLIAYDEHSPMILPFEESSEFLVNGKSTSNIFRARQTFGNESHIGAMITDRRYDIGGSGSVLSFDMAYRFHKNYQVEFQMLASHTGEPDDSALTADIGVQSFNHGEYTAEFDGESFWGHGIYASFERHARHFWFDLDYMEKSPTFRADNGFETSNNSRVIDLDAGIDIRPKSKIIANISPYFGIGRKWNFAKERKDEWIRLSTSIQLPGQTYIEPSYLISWERLRGVNFPNITRYALHVNSRFSDPVNIGFSIATGHLIARNVYPLPVMGKETNVSVWATLKPIDRIRITHSYDYVKSDTLSTDGNIFEVYAFRTRIDCQFTHELSCRFITQYNDFRKSWEFDPLVKYKLNPFTQFYFGSTHDFSDFNGYKDFELKQTARQFFFKIQYLLQI